MRAPGEPNERVLHLWAHGVPRELGFYLWRPDGCAEWRVAHLGIIMYPGAQHDWNLFARDIGPRGAYTAGVNIGGMGGTWGPRIPSPERLAAMEAIVKAVVNDPDDCTCADDCSMCAAIAAYEAACAQPPKEAESTTP